MKFAFVLAAILILSIETFAQEHPAVTAQPNSVYVGADGKFEAAPDTAQIQMNVSVQDDNPQAAYQRASKNVDQVRAVLRANGLETKLATVGFLSVQPMYEWKPKQRVIGYRVTTDVALKLKDFSKIGPISQQLAEANVSETQTLNYTLENRTRRRTARWKTLTGARETPLKPWPVPAEEPWVIFPMHPSIPLRIREW